MSAPDLARAEALAERALALLQASRRAASRDGRGRAIPLHAQDRRRWDRGLIAEAMRLVDRALGAREVGPLTLRAAIDALHAQASDASATDWYRIAALYDLLAEIDPSPEVAAERTAARARCGLRRAHPETSEVL
jgi:RNA polymerase sigma-70 factor (ECF subfamily)